ncbi:tagaturonate reductase [Aquiflexum balticum DSM 16537]|uniref:Tagaturonate reductase n=1 Tax=Aquiflexum balticum DSM 16537 TaxID=758820 RepID=A0A1W2H8P5_9BACT|nr:tagaturonate reductase [Aquiflexum balticum]SMD45253.1 tagaturonate reductase [Aquiflexum balticum DSM 16537]
MKPLNRNNIKVPERPIKVLQFGEGNFLRGFVDWMIDVMNEKTDFNGDVQIVQPLSQGMGNLLNSQDGLFHVKLEGIQSGEIVQKARLITCVKGVTNPFEDYNAYLKLGENKDLKFVISNTTEAGIIFDSSDNSFEVLPLTFPGKLTSLLFHRFNNFSGAPDKGLVIIPCELIDKNGIQLKSTVLDYARLWNLPETFTKWLNEHNIFCNTLVDRIVPGFPKENIMEIQNELGFEDNLVVMAEPFHFWVIESPENLQEIFPAIKAGLQVKFVQDQSPYRTRKVRILNGAHSALVPVAYLSGFRTVREAVADKKIGKFISDTIYEEIIPTLDLPKEELEQFASDVMDRFLNPFIHHKLISISLNSISKFKVRVLPSLLEYHSRKGNWPKNLTRSLAALLKFYSGKAGKETIELKDDAHVLEFFEKIWKEEELSFIVSETLGRVDFWGEDLRKFDGLEKEVLKQLEELV